MKISTLLVSVMAAMSYGCAATPAIEGDARADLPRPQPQTGTRLIRRAGVDSGRNVQTMTEDQIDATGASNVEDLLRR